MIKILSVVVLLAAFLSVGCTDIAKFKADETEVVVNLVGGRVYYQPDFFGGSALMITTKTGRIIMYNISAKFVEEILSQIEANPLSVRIKGRMKIEELPISVEVSDAKEDIREAPQD